MATKTYRAIATTTLSADTGSITFSSIPATDQGGNNIRDIMLVMSYKASSSAFAGKVYLNGDTGANYDWVRLNGSGSSVTQTSGASGSIRWDIQTTADAMARVEILDAKATDKHKIAIVRADSAATGTQMSANRWKSTAAVTSITIEFGTNLLAGSTLSLYGVVA